MRSLVGAFIAALAIAAPAAAHIGFADGPKSARLIAAKLNGNADFEQVRCSYQRPHVICTGIVKEGPRTDVWYRFRMTVHKTAPKKGYAMTCLTALGICQREALTFAT